jgi:hypothetical protein
VGGSGGAGGAGGAGGVGGTGGAGGGTSGAPCGGLPGQPCASGFYCDWGDNSCGSADQQGTCQPRPEVCPQIEMPVCACNGQVYGNDCEAAAAGQDVRDAGGCPAPQGQFGCGWRFCRKGQQYCERTRSDVGGVGDSYACRQLPISCTGSALGCACLAGVPCATMCQQSAGGDLMVTCAGG